MSRTKRTWLCVCIVLIILALTASPKPQDKSTQSEIGRGSQGEQRRDPPTWVPLQDWVQLLIDQTEQRIEQRFDLTDRYINQRFSENESAKEVATKALNERLEHNNNLVDAMRKQADTMALKSEMTALEESLKAFIASIEKRLAALELDRSSREGKTTGGEPMRDIGMQIVFAVIAALIGFGFGKLGTKKDEPRAPRV